MIKQFYVLALSILSEILSADPSTNLYKLSGVEATVELSGSENLKVVEDDIKEFTNLGTYKPTTFSKIDQSDRLAGARITQQILKQGESRAAMDFLQMPEEARNSGCEFIVEEMEKLGHINFEEFYDYETNSYLQRFASKEALASMKKLHQEYFSKQEQNAEKPNAFFQNEMKNFEKKPKELKKDFKSSFMAVENKNKLFPLLHLWEYLDNRNCWASSRYEFGFALTLYYVIPKLKWWGIFPYVSLTISPYQVNVILFASYPCSTHTSGWMWWYWLSERIPVDHQMKEVTFRLEFETTKRVRFLSVLFLTAPQSVRIESTQDGANWEVAQDWSKSPVLNEI